MSKPEPLDLSSVIAAAKAGDEGAKNDLFKRFYPRVQRAVHVSLATDMRANRPWLASRFSTGDIVQEVFRSVLGDLNSFGGATEDAFAGYLAMVVRNRIIDAIRHHQADKRDGRLGVEAGEQGGSEGTPVDRAIANEERALYDRAFKTLSDAEQLLLRGRFEDSIPFTRLAEQLGYANESAARRAFFEAQARLTIRLRDSGDAGENPPQNQVRP